MKAASDLSIVIPTLNEAVHLRKLLAAVARQQGVEMEVIIVDGGSRDSTPAVGEDSRLRTVTLRSGRGRATQLNAGAAAAQGEFLLFLHADSELHDCRAFRNALDALRRASFENSGKPYAGHFAVRFRSDTDSRSRAYKLLECKARLNRKGCSHGDQGILVPAALFRKLGGFDGSCQILAETRFADRLRENGQWLLLPAELTTSTRRFEIEGLKERQTLNAVIMALGAVGRDDMIDLSAVYPANASSTKLELQPVFRNIAAKIKSLEEIERAEFWEKVGGYICENAWQAAFRLDLLLQGSAVDAAAEGHYRFLAWYDRYLQRLADNRICLRLTASASRLWLTYMARA